MKMNFRSQTRGIFVGKIWGPLLCGLIGVGVLVNQQSVFAWGSVLAIPFLIVALFGASLAVLQVRGGAIRYRRFVKWTALSKEEIVSARIEAAPLVGSVRLKRFLFSLGQALFRPRCKINSEPVSHRGISYGPLSLRPRNSRGSQFRTGKYEE